jgi:methionyl-tRNA formyltransferase
MMSAVQQSFRIVFMGTPPFAVPTLEALLRSDDPIVGVVSQPDRPSGRGRYVQPTPVKRVALAHDVPVLQPRSLRAEDARVALGRLAPDLIVVAAYGNLLPRAVLDLPAHGCINVHASLLPRHRGAAPVQWALMAGEAVTGVTIMQMNEGLDEGDILLQRETRIESTDTGETLGHRLAHLGAAALIEAIAALKRGTLRARPQDAAAATLAPRIRKEMGRMDWSRPAEELERRIRALQPWPTAYTSLHGRRLTVLRARVIRAAAGFAARPGTVMEGVDASSGPDVLTVVTGTDLLGLEVVQLEGRRPLPAGEFLRGHPVAPGTVLGT